MSLPTLSLESVSMSDLESMVPELDALSAIDAMLQRGENAWVCFEADVRSAAATALDRLRGAGGERCTELLRLCEFEEQTRCQAFQATMMAEVEPQVYQATVRSILEKLLNKLETYAVDPSLYQAAAQCLSEYMSALNHHCDICSVPRPSWALPAIAEGRDEEGMGSDCIDSSDYPSELGSEDAETLSVHSEDATRRMSYPDGLQHAASASTHSKPPAHLGLSRAAASSASVLAAPSLFPNPSVEAAAAEEARKERRRESNKKASVRYRSKKSSTMQQVVAELTAARQQITALTSHNAVLSAENSLLKQQVAFLQSVVQPQPRPHAVGVEGAPSSADDSDTSTGTGIDTGVCPVAITSAAGSAAIVPTAPSTGIDTGVCPIAITNAAGSAAIVPTAPSGTPIAAAIPTAAPTLPGFAFTTSFRAHGATALQPVTNPVSGCAALVSAQQSGMQPDLPQSATQQTCEAPTQPSASLSGASVAPLPQSLPRFPGTSTAAWTATPSCVRPTTFASAPVSAAAQPATVEVAECGCGVSEWLTADAHLRSL